MHVPIDRRAVLAPNPHACTRASTAHRRVTRRVTRHWRVCRGLLRLASLPMCCAALSAGAVTLPPDGVALLGDGTSSQAEPQLAGTVVAERTTKFRYIGYFDRDIQRPGERRGPVFGTVQSQVVQAADGTYDFYWRIQLPQRSFLPVALFALDGFDATDYNAGWRNDADAGTSPAYARAEAGRITFAFGQYLPPSSLIHPGGQSAWFFLDTQATGYAESGSFVLHSERDGGGDMMTDWGGVSRPHGTFAPVFGGRSVAMAQGAAPVPEPGTWGLMAIGLTALGVAARRRRSRG